MIISLLIVCILNIFDGTIVITLVLIKLFFLLQIMLLVLFFVILETIDIIMKDTFLIKWRLVSHTFIVIICIHYLSFQPNYSKKRNQSQKKINKKQSKVAILPVNFLFLHIKRLLWVNFVVRLNYNIKMTLISLSLSPL